MWYNKIMKAMGIDFGMARIGIALSDDTKFLASPFITYKRKNEEEDIYGKAVDAGAFKDMINSAGG